MHEESRSCRQFPGWADPSNFRRLSTYSVSDNLSELSNQVPEYQRLAQDGVACRQSVTRQGIRPPCHDEDVDMWLAQACMVRDIQAVTATRHVEISQDNGNGSRRIVYQTSCYIPIFCNNHWNVVFAKHFEEHASN